MIESTFQILPRLGPKKETMLWESGIRRWCDFIDCDCVCNFKGDVKSRMDSQLNYAYELLDSGDCSGLGNMLKPREHWRLFDRFKGSVGYLDIETDGLDRDSEVTVVTIHKKGGTVTLVNGQGLDAGSLKDAMSDVSMLVTFNGRCFDVPVLRYSFPEVDWDIPHFDLRFGCKDVGLKGGLKSIEKEIGIARSDDISDVDGFEAVRLWKRWTRDGDRDSLDRLVEYNRADTVNLEVLADTVYPRLVKEYAGFVDDTS
ncbi:MAG: ribonuclease H-like domain-containing protein [Candidatus Methanomethylophilaceae archaeon]|nr:ribonuclease H-like domain-containing protein [Candidatus Methanomethylophilaceae archaeon]MDY5872969.1 ribonuclease H-like domain-containing protein [Candidatus Methanomethylophilaceae archaeon]